MATTIQVSEELVEVLKKRKLVEKESYEEVIWDLLEDTEALSEETLKEIAIARQEIKEGKTKTLEQIKKELRL
ncbi:hypothetical protein HZA99_00255 [Candidatus Woesearchaeota archaeon]|nr:hypothetical protein [Candidatus Woesearchaeota archaeon]